MVNLSQKKKNEENQKGTDKNWSIFIFLWINDSEIQKYNGLIIKWKSQQEQLININQHHEEMINKQRAVQQQEFKEMTEMMDKLMTVIVKQQTEIIECNWRTTNRSSRKYSN